MRTHNRWRQTLRQYLYNISLLTDSFRCASQSGVRRLVRRPIIRASMLPGTDGRNINGPSLVRVPDWITDRLGRYYLYFAHHHGTYLRMAYADALDGPWKIYSPGVLQIRDTRCNDFPTSQFAQRKHIASPDVHVDDHRREIIMYFHGPLYFGEDSTLLTNYRQVSLRAVSGDGLHFTAAPEIIDDTYLRMFRYDNWWYAIARLGVLYRSKDGITAFERGPNPFVHIQNPSTLRHAAVLCDGDVLHVYYSRIGDCPESILYSAISLSADWNNWIPSPPQLIMKPEFAFEGAYLPLQKSRSGAARQHRRELRDPAVFVEGDRCFLLYSVAGEAGIAIAEVPYPNG